ITSFPTQSKNSFTINNKIGIYIKYSAKGASPWNFTFKRQHQEEIKIMSELHNNIFIVFVCNINGITCLDYKNLKFLLDEQYDDTEWIKLSRLGAERYTVTGKDGKLPFKLTLKNYPRDIIKAL
ncbi:MAG: hypothetical protein ACJ0QV_00985, partial [Gammaproteobacteria bacterium]